MKSFSLLCFALLLFGSTVFSQEVNDRKVYLDSLFKETSQENHTYYRIIKDYHIANKNSYNVLDYYKSGAIQMDGNFVDKEGIQKEGRFTYYYENGNKSSVCTYENSFQAGPYTYWYENGQKKQQGEYSKAKTNEPVKFTIEQYWDEENIQRVINGNGNFTNNNIKDKIYETGKIKNGAKDSIWTGQNDLINFSYTENYKNGKLISGVSIDASQQKHDYTELEVRPQPKKGMQHFYSYIAKNLKIPNVNLSGKLLLSFIVNKDGSIAEVTILKGLHPELDRNAIKTVSSYSDWQPGKLRGIDVRLLYSIPISIVH